MNHTRKQLNVSSFFRLAGISLILSAILSSCFLRKDKSELTIDYLGNREGFERVQNHFKRLKGTRIVFSTFETALSDNSSIVFLDTDAATKSAYILMLLESGKDILTPYPMGITLNEYANISEFMEKYGSVVGLLNPVAFYPSAEMLQELVASQKNPFSQVRVNCHPTDLGGNFITSGTTGTAQLMQGIISMISDSYPLSLQADTGDDGSLDRINLNYEHFSAEILFDVDQLGWNMEFRGADFKAIIDHTGLLALSDEVEPHLPPDPAALDKAIRANLEDFIQAVSDQAQPRVNHLDGLASIMLNNAEEKSLEMGLQVAL